jgi:molybdenum cofactor cytidylyltransferase
MSTGVLILAAGAAFRMNEAKMLLAFGSTSILGHIVEEVKASKPDHICLVTGYYHKEIVESIDISGLFIVHNEHWREGMASSISRGVREMIKKYPAVSSVMIVVSDQPHLNRKVLHEMFSEQTKTKKGIIAAQYGKVTGTPVLFAKKYFNQLMELTGDTGAKSILQQHKTDIATVEFSLGAIDIDTAEDYEKFSGKTKK